MLRFYDCLKKELLLEEVTALYRKNARRSGHQMDSPFDINVWGELRFSQTKADTAQLTGGDCSAADVQKQP